MLGVLALAATVPASSQVAPGDPGSLTTLAGSLAGNDGDGGLAQAARFVAPRGLAVDRAGNVLVAESSRIRKVSANGIISTIAGGAAGFGGDGGAAIHAKFDRISGIALDGKGAMWVSDSGNNRIRRIAADGIVTTVAGNGADAWPDPAVDGIPATQSRVTPIDVAVDGAGNVFVSEWARIRRVGTDGTITTVAGRDGTKVSTPAGDEHVAISPADGMPATFANLNPRGLAIDPRGTLVFTDETSHRVFRIEATGTLTAVAGSGACGRDAAAGRNDTGDGLPARLGILCSPSDVAFDAVGNMYIAETQWGNRLRVVDHFVGTIRTAAGGGSPVGSDMWSGTLWCPAFVSEGPAGQVDFCSPAAVAAGTDAVYVADRGFDRVRALRDGHLTTFAGARFAGDGGPAREALLDHPSGLAMHPSGAVYIADEHSHRVRVVDSSGSIRTIAGSGRPGATGDGGPAVAATLHGPRGLALAPDGSLYIADTGNNRVRLVRPSGEIETVAGGPGNELIRPTALAVDRSGRLLIADTRNHRIVALMSDGSIVTVAGNGSAGYSGDGGAAWAASFSGPEGIAVDPAGNIVVADSGNKRLRRITADGVVRTIAGNGGSGCSAGRPAPESSLDPGAVTTAPTGEILVVVKDGCGSGLAVLDQSGDIVPLLGSDRGVWEGVPHRVRLELVSSVAADGRGNITIADAGRHGSPARVVIIRSADLVRPAATVVPPSRHTEPAVARFTEPVWGMTPAAVHLRLDGRWGVEVTIACRDAANAPVACETGPVSFADIRPEDGYGAGVFYELTLNGGPWGSTHILDRVDNTMKPATYRFTVPA